MLLNCHYMLFVKTWSFLKPICTKLTAARSILSAVRIRNVALEMQFLAICCLWRQSWAFLRYRQMAFTKWVLVKQLTVGIHCAWHHTHLCSGIASGYFVLLNQASFTFSQFQSTQTILFCSACRTQLVVFVTQDAGVHLHVFLLAFKLLYELFAELCFSQLNTIELEIVATFLQIKQQIFLFQ